MSKYQPFNKYILRTPIGPINKLEASKTDLNTFAKDAVFLQSIRLASPSLYQQFLKWITGSSTKINETRLYHSLLKYYIRSNTRCTPFGLFAGLCIGTISDETKIVLDDLKNYLPHTRLDMNYLCGIIQELEKEPAIRAQLTYFPNNSLYELGKKLRYIEYYYVNNKRQHQISGTQNDEYLQAVLKKAKKGASIETLSKLLIGDGISYEDACNYISILIDHQVLISELQPVVTGKELHNFLIQKLKKLSLPSSQILHILNSVTEKLNLIDQTDLGEDLNSYSEISNELKQLPIPFEEKFLFQTDLILSASHNTIGNEVLENIQKALEVLNKLSIPPASNNLSAFKSAFIKRYEDREVPLVEVMDTESGIGFLQNNTTISGDDTPLVDDLLIPNPENKNQTSTIQWDRTQRLLLRKYVDALKENAAVIEIEEDDLKDFEANWEDLPATISVMTEIVKEKNKNPKVIIGSVGGSSAVNLLGRFAHADASLKDFIAEIVQKETALQPEVELVEIVHLPESRVGNILARPVFRKYEIPYLAQSSVEEAFQLNLDDLMISVQQNKIILRSKKLDKEIKPHLSNAHNYLTGVLPAYQFLASLQYQDRRRHLNINWNFFEQEFRYIPRVVYKNTILALATWIIEKEMLNELFNIKEEDQLVKGFQEIKRKNKIPKDVVLVDGDNKLYIDTEQPSSIKLLLSIVKNRGGFKLQEYLFPAKTDALVKDQKGNQFTNQVIFSFYKNQS